MSVVVLGAVFVDVKGYPTSSFIATGRNAGRIEQVHGGVSRNVAENIANMNQDPIFVSLVDDTGMGEDVINRLNECGCNTKYMQRVHDGMGTWLAIFDANGDVCASISKRPDLSLILDILNKKGDEIFSNASSVAIEFDMEEDILQKVISLANKHNTKLYAVISNMTIAIERKSLFKYIDCFVCNIQEAELLFNKHLTTISFTELPLVIKSNIKELNLKNIVVTMGEYGSVYASLDGESGYITPTPVNVVDTTGAGDAFFSGVVVGLINDKSLKESCIIGSKVASKVITNYNSVCPKIDIKELGIDK